MYKRLILFLCLWSILVNAWAAKSEQKLTCDFGKQLGSITFIIDLPHKKVDTIPRGEDEEITVASRTWKIIGSDGNKIPLMSHFDEMDFRDLTISLKGSDADDTAYRVNIYFGIQGNQKIRATFSVLPFDDSRLMETYSAQDCILK